MSQTTRCPSCATLFKVVPDQLRISDGWVRCGQCKKVFDATLSLLEILAPVPLQDRNAEHSEAPSLGDDASNALKASDLKPSLSDLGSNTNTAEMHGVEPDSASAQVGKTLLDDPELSADGSPESGLTARVLNGSPPHGQRSSGREMPVALLGGLIETGAPDGSEPVTQESETRFTAESAKDSHSSEETVDGPTFTAASTVEEQKASEHEDSTAKELDGEADAPVFCTNRAEATAPASAGGLAAEDPATRTASAAETLAEELSQPFTAPQEPSFVRSARRKALWSKPSVRLVLGAVAVLLAAGLLVQVALQRRDYLASAQPQWRSALEALCVPLQCAVRPYQQIASVAVDSSSFNKLRGNTYRFALVLKNQSALAVALPAVELTLTDTSDQPVLRRVITPLELSAPATLPSGGEWVGSVEMDIGLDGNSRISGYRVLVFYP